jgi:RES domain-containing protein
VALFDASKLTKLPGATLSVAGYRNQASGFDPRSGDGARRFGGRFNPPHSFPVIYLCTSRPCVVAELTRQAQRQSLTVDDLLPRELWRITVELTNVLDLTHRETLHSLEIDPTDLVRDDLQFTREIGEAAHARRFQAIRSASATGVDDVVGIMPENLAGVVLLAELIQEWRTAAELT